MIIDTYLNDGTQICIRRVNKDDETRLRDGIAQLSPRSRYLRFFTGLKQPSDQIIRSLIDVDGYEHIAWGAIRTDISEYPATGIVHAFRDKDDNQIAEFSVAVIDQYHGLGLGRLLSAVLLIDSKRLGLSKLTVNIMSDNNAAISFVRSLGAVAIGPISKEREFEIDIDKAISLLRSETGVAGLANVLDAFGIAS